MAKELIKARNLSVHFNRNGKLYKAVDKVDFTVKQGEILAVVGESGSGKTTLGRALLGLWDHATGSVTIDGELISKKRVRYVTKKNRWIYEKGQMIYQDPSTSLNEVKKVSEILSEGLINFKILERERDEKIHILETKLIKLVKEVKQKTDHVSFIEYKINEKLDKSIDELRVNAQKSDQEFQKLLKLKQTHEAILKEIKELKKKIIFLKKKSFIKIQILKKEKISNIIKLKENMEVDKLELVTAQKDEKAEARQTNKLSFETSAFKIGNKAIKIEINKQISDMSEKINDIDLKVKKLKTKARTEKHLDLRKIYVGDVATMKYEAKLLNEILLVYKGFKNNFESYTKELTSKKSEDTKKYYKVLLKDNQKAFTIFVSLNSWKFKNAIEREKNRINVRVKDLKDKIHTLNFKLTNLLKDYKINDYHKAVENIEEKIKVEITKLNNKAKNEIAKDIKNLPKPTKTLAAASKEISNIASQIQETKRSLIGNQKKKILSQKLAEILKIVGMSEEELNKFPSQFSGGQKQRIGIARSILTNPKFIVADEPISALDVSLQAGVLNLLKDLQKKFKMSIVFVAHDLEMVNYVADRICVLYKGKIVEMGPAESVYKKPIHPYTKALINAQPSINKPGQKLKTAEYDESSHKYNEYKDIKEWEARKGHFVYGTKEEVIKWSKNKKIK